jgi:hypothetical protein
MNLLWQLTVFLFLSDFLVEKMSKSMFILDLKCIRVSNRSYQTIVPLENLRKICIIKSVMKFNLLFCCFIFISLVSVIFQKTEMKRTLSIVCFFSFTLFIIVNSEFFRSIFFDDELLHARRRKIYIYNHYSRSMC